MPDLAGLHRIAVAEYQAGSAHRWKACLAASVIVGKYQAGATLALASDLCISVSQVENLARAGVTWRGLRYFGCDSALRARLTPSHFAAMGELFRRYEFSPQEAVSILVEAANQGASVAAMRDYVDGEYGQDLPAWVKRLERITPQVQKLIDDYGVPLRVREAALEFINAIKDNGATERETNLSAGERAAPILE